MKNLTSCLLFLIFFNSCSTDNEPTIIDDQQAADGTRTTMAANRLGDIYPANSDNPYDNAGKVYNEILSAYYEGTDLPTNVWVIAGRVKTVADLNPGFSALKLATTRDTNVAKVQEILANPNTCIADVIAGTKMSSTGKSSLNAFMITAVILMQPDIEYSVLYDFVCSYESNILKDPLLTDIDRKVIMTTTSITRYTVHMRQKRPKKNTDPDWTIFIASIIGGTYGSEYDIAESITTALACGIAQNK